MNKITILGCGYTGQALARQSLVSAHASDVLGTRREATGIAELEAQGIPALMLASAPSEAVIDRLEQTTHLLTSVAPARSLPLQDPMLDLVRSLSQAGRLPRLRWIGYLSTIGVYGDHAGEWVDENTPCMSQQIRSIMRVMAERGWQALAREMDVAAAVLRLSGIYGPGRNALVDVQAGKARRIIKPNHVFNRIHVDDIARFCLCLIEARQGGVFNVTDDKPAPSAEVVAHACRLLGCEVPEPIAFKDARMSEMALSFWAECKRVDNQRSREVPGFHYRYPDYTSGLASLLDVTEEMLD